MAEETKALTIQEENCVKIHCPSCSAVLPLHPTGLLSCNTCGSVWKAIVDIAPVNFNEVILN